MPWEPSPPDGSQSYAVAIANFKGDGDHQMSIDVGDRLEIVESNGDWYRGRKRKGEGRLAIFPANYVALKPCTLIKAEQMDDVVLTAEDPVFDEISSSLRLWNGVLQRLYSGLKMDVFNRVKTIMADLMLMRRQILAGTLSHEQVLELRRQAAGRIDKGNRLLGLEMVLRAPGGEVVDTTAHCAAELHDRYLELAERARLKAASVTAQGAAALKAGLADGQVHHLLFEMKNFVCMVGEPADLYFSLYCNSTGNFVSEEYLVRLTRAGMPVDVKRLGNLRTLFADLSTLDLTDELFLVCKVIRVGKMNYGDTSKKASTNFRRPFGCATMDISAVLRQLDAGGAMGDEREFHIPIFGCKDDYFHDIHVSILNQTEQNTYKPVEKAKGLYVTFKVLHGDVAELRQEHPLVFKDLPTTRKIGFPDVILPGDVRNDLYVTLLCADFAKGKKSSEKNVEVMMCIVTSDGKTIPNCISLGSGGENLVEEFQSCIIYHSNSPRWNETLRLNVPIGQFERAHLKFYFRHCSSAESKDKEEKTFAFSFIPLMESNGTTIVDATHPLSVYKYERRLDNPDLYLKCTDWRFSKLVENGPVVRESKPAAIAAADRESSSRKSEKGGRRIDKLLERLRHDTEGTSGSGSSSNDKFKPDVPAKGAGRRLSVDPSAALRTGGGSGSGSGGGGGDGGPLQRSPKEYFVIRTTLCSTKLTQKESLLGLLKWRSHQGDLESTLKRLTFVEGEEIVKFLQDIFDALFAILDGDTDKYARLVFDALVFIICTISDKKYSHFRQVLDLYITRHFSGAMAHQHLIKCLRTQLDRAARREPGSGKEVRAAMKALEYLFKFIVQSRLLAQRQAASAKSAEEQQAEENAFKAEVLDVFQAFNNLMKATASGDLIGTQLTALQHFPSIFGDLKQLFSYQYLSLIALKFIESVQYDATKPKLTQHKMQFLETLVAGPLFGQEETRLHILPVLLRHMQLHLGNADELQSSCGVIAGILRTLHNNITEREKWMLTSLLWPLLKAYRMDRAAGHVAVCLVGVLDAMDAAQYEKYLSVFTDAAHLTSFLGDVLRVLHALVLRSPFPREWTVLHALVMSIVSKAVLLLCPALLDAEFSAERWESFFTLAVDFVTSPHLQLELATDAQRRRMLGAHGDLRTRVGFFLKEMWDNLSDFQIHFVPGLAGPLLKVTMVPERALQRAVIPCVFDMLAAEWGARGNFGATEAAVFDQLDGFVNAGRGDARYKELFASIVGARCAAAEPALAAAGAGFVASVERIVSSLLELRALAASAEYRDHYAEEMTKHMAFIKSIHRTDMYIKYTHQLESLHYESGNFVEAAYALLRHAELLGWGDAEVAATLDGKYAAQTEASRKERIYSRVIENLDKGKSWETAIDLCKELAQLYELRLFDYTKLSATLQKQANYFSSIATVPRYFSEYFRVGYYGKGFPEGLRNKEFIYRGFELERIANFCERIQGMHAGAQMLKTNTPPGDDVLLSDAQWIQVVKVDPTPAPPPKFREGGAAGAVVPEAILQYYRSNEVDEFSFSRPFRKGKKTGNEFADLWTAKTFLLTKERLPGALRRSEVAERRVEEISPIENALGAMRDKNKELTGMIRQFSGPGGGAGGNVNPLTMALNGIIDAAVNGGTEMYQKAFMAKAYVETYPEHAPWVEELKAALREQTEIVEGGLALHKRVVPEAMLPLQNKMEEFFVVLKEKNLRSNFDDL